LDSIERKVEIARMAGGLAKEIDRFQNILDWLKYAREKYKFVQIRISISDAEDEFVLNSGMIGDFRLHDCLIDMLKGKIAERKAELNELIMIPPEEVEKEKSTAGTVE